MEFTHKKRGRVDLLFLDGRLDNEASQELKTIFRETVKKGRARLVLDLNGVTFVDSSGLGALVACLRTATAREGDLKLSGLNPRLSSVFELTRLHRLFEVYATPGEAADSFEEG